MILSRTSRTSCSRCRCRPRLTMRRCFILVCLYGGLVYIWVNVVSASMSAGYSQEDQPLGPVSLALLPLVPWLRVADRQAMPSQTSSSFQKHKIQQGGEFSVAIMPKLLDSGASNDDLAALELHLGSELSGCDPKFILTSPGSNTSTYLFKPSPVQHKVWNELLAYHINAIAGFDRVPTVRPYEIIFEKSHQID